LILNELLLLFMVVVGFKFLTFSIINGFVVEEQEEL